METFLKQNGFTDLEIIIIRWQLNDFGHFYKALMEAVSCADAKNTERIRRGFPDHVKAMEKFRTIAPDGELDFYVEIAEKLDKFPKFAGRF